MLLANLILCWFIHCTGVYVCSVGGSGELLAGDFSQAIVKFEESIDSQTEWRQFHHICYWELMWCHRYAAINDVFFTNFHGPFTTLVLSE